MRLSPALILLCIMSLGGASMVYQARLDKKYQLVLSAQTERNAEVKKLIAKREYWEKIVADSPTFRDGYLQLAVINYQLEDYPTSQMWLGKTLEADPNYVLPATLSFLLAGQ